MVDDFRSYLRIIADSQIDPAIRHKIDLSGVVQQTLLEGHRDQECLSLERPEQQAAWLRKILARNLTDEVRKLYAKKRDIRLERSLDEKLTHSASCLGSLLAHQEGTPSQQAMRFEEILSLSRELEALPEEQRNAISCRYLKGYSLSQIAEEMDKTKAAVAGLLQRGLRQLRLRLKSETE